MIPVVLAGGSGTRFWPLSRRDKPKQLLSVLGDDRSLVQTTVDRVAPLCAEGRPVYLVCRPELREATQGVLDDSSDVEFLLEPSARNTAPAIIVATAMLESQWGDEAIGFFPSDHFVADQTAFEACLHYAADRADQAAIITIGIPPTRPETGYGYIESEETIDGAYQQLQARKVSAFVEKPDHRRALQYLRSQRFLWNAGIFVFRPSTLWRELEAQRPPMWEATEELRSVVADKGSAEQLARAFCALPSISIDYAVMEGAEHVEVVPAPFRWSDVGHWGALDEVFDTDENGNVTRGDTLLDEVTRSVVFSQRRDRLIAASGLDRMVVVDTDDALLIIPRDRTQKVRELVDQLELLQRDDLL